MTTIFSKIADIRRLNFQQKAHQRITLNGIMGRPVLKSQSWIVQILLKETMTLKASNI